MGVAAASAAALFALGSRKLFSDFQAEFLHVVLSAAGRSGIKTPPLNYEQVRERTDNLNSIIHA